MAFKLLFISAIAPYDKIGHAGGKTHNYYLKKFSSDHDFEVRLLSFTKEKDVKKLDYSTYNIRNDIFVCENNGLKLIKRILMDGVSLINIFDKYAGLKSNYKKTCILKKLKQYKREGYYPDIIILEWTQMVLFVNEIKKIYPNSKYIASEHDVTFLGFKRIYLAEENIFLKYMKKVRFNNCYKSELEALKQYDLVLPHNYKDVDLLLKSGIKKEILDYICPYYDDYSIVNNNFNNKNIIFFGDMRRAENYTCCIWFIENVFNKLLKNDITYKFFIIGGNPPDIIKKYSSENIIITGYVDSLVSLFSNAICMAAPLLTGAGIKVKVLEVMSAGVVVLTNDIGIEGIPAEDKIDFIMCKTSDDYLKAIMNLNDDSYSINQISEHSKMMIKNKFDLNNSFIKYKKNILKFFKNNMDT